MMELLETLREHKVLLAAIIAVPALAIALVCVAVNVNRTGRAGEGGAAANEQLADGDAGRGDDKLATLRQRYGEGEKTLVQELAKGEFSAAGGKATVSFNENTYTETLDGTKTEHPWAIKSLKKEADQAGNETTVATVETDGGTHTLTYGTMRGTDPQGNPTTSSYVLAPDMLQRNDLQYTRADKYTPINVEDPNKETQTLIGDKTEELRKAIGEWCANRQPTATKATWNKITSVNWDTEKVTTGYTLDDKAHTSITVTYDQKGGTFSLN